MILLKKQIMLCYSHSVAPDVFESVIKKGFGI